ncbi:hypothetical protein ACFFX0_20360 [Citricoccus parietis]|uniref:Uncharacterized protein n=1 Tax=Citricoccus parietis TaxID=592307 RepID=A0ABV5G3B1_9MICC
MRPWCSKSTSNVGDLPVPMTGETADTAGPVDSIGQCREGRP